MSDRMVPPAETETCPRGACDHRDCRLWRRSTEHEPSSPVLDAAASEHVNRTVHLVGFGDRRPTSITLCPEGETPHEAYERIRSNAEHFGHEVSDVRYTYLLGGRPIDASEVSFTVDEGMWHVVSEAGPDEWVRKPAAEAVL